MTYTDATGDMLMVAVNEDGSAWFRTRDMYNVSSRIVTLTAEQVSDLIAELKAKGKP